MAFPTTGILDNFNRADEGPPPSASWTDEWLAAGSGLNVQTNQLATNFGGQSYWSASLFGPSAECYATVINYTGPIGLGIRLNTPTSALTSGYAAMWDGVTDAAIERIDNSVETVLGATFASSPTGGSDKIGVEITGSLISAYDNIGVGGWAFLSSRTDGTYSGTGYVGAALIASSSTMDDFGGGTTVAAGGGPPLAPNRLYRTAVRTGSTW